MDAVAAVGSDLEKTQKKAETETAVVARRLNRTAPPIELYMLIL